MPNFQQGLREQKQIRIRASIYFLIEKVHILELLQSTIYIPKHRQLKGVTDVLNSISAQMLNGIHQLI